MDEKWMLQPKKGLGPLWFGMTEAEAIAVGSGIYGEVESAGSLGHDSNKEVYQILLEAMGEAAAKEAMAELKSAEVTFKPSRRISFSSGIMADFVEDRLDGLIGRSGVTQLHCNGKAFFQTDPVPALQQLQLLNKSAPLVKGPDCYFKSIEVTAWQCVLLMPYPVFRATIEGTEESDQKTIGWRATPRNMAEDFSNHKALDLLP